MKPILFILLIPCLALVSCVDDPDDFEKIQNLQYKVDDLKDDLSDLKEKNEKLKNKSAEDLAELQKQIEQLKSEAEMHKKQSMEAEQKAKDSEQKLIEYKEQYRISLQRKLQGKEIGDLVLNSGKVYKKTTLTKLDAEGLSISHDGGLAKVKFMDLPPQTREAYGFDPSASKKYDAMKQQKMANIRAFQQQQASAVASQKARNNERLAAAQKQQDASNRAQRVVTLNTQITKARARIKAIDEEVRERKHKQAVANHIYGRTASHTSGITKLNAEKTRLENAIISAKSMISELSR